MNFYYYTLIISNKSTIKGNIQPFCFFIMRNLSNIYLRKRNLAPFSEERDIKYPIFMYSLILILLYLI